MNERLQSTACVHCGVWLVSVPADDGASVIMDVRTGRIAVATGEQDAEEKAIRGALANFL